MSSKTKALKTIRRGIREKSEEIGRHIADSFLLMPLKDRLKIAFKIIFKREVF